jgi:hypothetical protein
MGKLSTFYNINFIYCIIGLSVGIYDFTIIIAYLNLVENTISSTEHIIRLKGHSTTACASASSSIKYD